MIQQTDFLGRGREREDTSVLTMHVPRLKMVSRSLIVDIEPLIDKATHFYLAFEFPIDGSNKSMNEYFQLLSMRNCDETSIDQ